MRLTKKAGVAAAAAIAIIAATVTPAVAAGANYGRSWESGLGGILVNGYVQIQASYYDGGRHAKQGYQRFIRDAGPSLDTGRLYTSSATSAGSTTVRSRQDQVWDSVLWGDPYVTRYYYGIIYF